MLSSGEREVVFCLYFSCVTQSSGGWHDSDYWSKNSSRKMKWVTFAWVTNDSWKISWYTTYTTLSQTSSFNPEFFDNPMTTHIWLYQESSDFLYSFQDGFGLRLYVKCYLSSHLECAGSPPDHICLCLRGGTKERFGFHYSKELGYVLLLILTVSWDLKVLNLVILNFILIK